MDFYITIVFLCLISSFLFSASETALTSLGRLEIERLNAKGGMTARLLHIWVKDPNRMLIIVLVGNNAVNIIASSLFTLWATHRFPILVSVLLGFFTFVVIIFSEIIPKMFARHYSMLVAPFAIRFLSGVGVALAPVIWIIQKLTMKLVIGSAMPGRGDRKPITEEELTHTIEIAAREGGIDQETGIVLSNLLDFPDRRARDIMTARSKIHAISIAWTQEEVARFVAADGHSRYPVYRNSLDELVGLLLVKDFLHHVYRVSPGNWTRAVRRCYFVSEVSTAGRILKDMRRWGTHMALVRNEMGVLTGLITLEDLIEEIVGEIHDEHDDLAPGSQTDPSIGGRLIKGDMSVVDFNFQFSKNLPLEVDYSTLNGYILKKTGGISPQVGTLIFDDDVTFRVESMDESGVVTLEIVG